MFRTSGINSEIVDYLLDRVGKLKLGPRPSRRNATEPTDGARGSVLPSDDRFSHAVQELAALSLCARTILSLRS
jgi:hypothetical protein